LELMKIYTFILMVFVLSCAEKPDFSETPTLSFQSFSKQSMLQGSTNEDNVTLTLYFTDGDGDIGYSIDEFQQNLFITDNRTGDLFTGFKLPEIPIEGSKNGVSGTIELLIFTTCCIYPDGIDPCEIVDEFPSNDLSFDIYMLDRAGHISNTVTTPSISLKCY